EASDAATTRVRPSPVCGDCARRRRLQHGLRSGLPDEFTSPGATIEPVQGFAGLGTPGNQFAGSFLRYADGDLFDMALTLTDLPAHDTLTLGFLLAVIDSWDGTELLEVTVDDMVVFSHSFELATTDTSSYVPPEGGLLSSGTDLERDAEAVAE